MTPATITKLAQLGYWTRYGGDGQLHIIPRNHRQSISRGERGLCGQTASRRDYKNEKPSCTECMQLCMNEVIKKAA